MQAVRKGEQEAEQIVAAREAAAQTVQLLEPYYEAGSVVRAEAEGEGAVGEDAFKTDYLAPYLPHPTSRSLSQKQALTARAACLKVLTLHSSPPTPLPNSRCLPSPPTHTPP